MYHCFVRHHDGHGKRAHKGPPGYFPPPTHQTVIQVEEDPEAQGAGNAWGSGAHQHHRAPKKEVQGPRHRVGEGKVLPPHIKQSNYGGTFVVVGKKDKHLQQEPEESSSESFQIMEEESDPADLEFESQHATEAFEIERDPNAPPIKERGPLAGLPNNFTKDDFQNARGNATIEDALKNLAKFGTNVTDLNIEKKLKLKAPFKKACLICCNYYTKPSYALGAGPINDSATVADNHQQRGYECFYMVNPTPERFLDLAAFFFQNTKTALTIFFTGHGAQVKDQNGDEDDGFDECMVFDSGHIVDDDLLILIEDTCPKDLPVLLLTDCCHSGSIWDLQSEKNKAKLPNHIMSVSAAKDSQTAKQTTMNKKDQGIFTFYFWKILNSKPNMTPAEMDPLINKAMVKFNQHYTFEPSRPELANQPFFS